MLKKCLRKFALFNNLAHFSTEFSHLCIILRGFSLVLEYKNLSHSSISPLNAPRFNYIRFWYSLTSERKSAKIGAFTFEFELFKSWCEKGIFPFGFERARRAH